MADRRSQPVLMSAFTFIWMAIGVGSPKDNRGHEIEIACNGRQALDMFSVRPFDIVLMDVQMPVMDGLQATAGIRAIETKGGRRVPIVAMTAHAMPGDEERCHSAGMDAYLAKPVDTARLIEVVETLATRQNESLPISGSRLCAATDPLRPPSPRGENPVFDSDAALKRLGNDRQLFGNLVAFFLEDYPPLVDQIRNGIHTDNVKAVVLAAHSLKGLSSNFDAHEVVRIAARIEMAGRDGELATATDSLESLDRALDRLRDALLPYRGGSQ